MMHEPGSAGWSEATLEWHTQPVLSAVRDIADLFVGEDPRHVDHIWQLMRDNTSGMETGFSERLR